MRTQKIYSFSEKNVFYRQYIQVYNILMTYLNNTNPNRIDE
jgi:hypothetical protein